MPPFWNRTPQTVRPRLSYRASALFCLLVFAFTAIIVYWRGHKGWTAFGRAADVHGNRVSCPAVAAELHAPRRHEPAKTRRPYLSSRNERYTREGR